MIKGYGLTLVTYNHAAGHDLEPMHPVYVTIFKKRVCVYQISHDLSSGLSTPTYL